MPSASRNINRWRAFAVLAVAYFMTIVDLTIVNVSLPTIGRDLRFTQTSLQWVVTAYALTFGGFLLLGGRAAARMGGRGDRGPGRTRGDRPAKRHRGHVRVAR